MGVAIGTCALEAVGFEFHGQRRDSGDMLLNIAGTVFAALGRNADQIGEVNSLTDDLIWQAQYLDESLIPDPQAQSFVEDADALGHAI